MPASWMWRKICFGDAECSGEEFVVGLVEVGAGPGTAGLIGVSGVTGLPPVEIARIHRA